MTTHQFTIPRDDAAAGWYVLGAGAMGCLFGVALRRTGVPVTLLQRSDRGVSEVNLRLEVAAASDEWRMPVEPCAAPGSIGRLLVTTKAPDVVDAVKSVAHRLEQTSQVLLLANGMGFAEHLAKDLPDLQIFQGTTTEGAYRLGPWHLRHAGRGQTRLGRPGGGAAPGWFEQWSTALDDCLWDEDIDAALWLKLAINCAINPLTALHRCPNGELARDPALSARVRGLCQEITRVCTAAGYPQVAERVPTAVANVIAGTAENRSSMLQDVEAGRRTEIEYITGFLVNEGSRLGLATPLNSALLDEVRTLGA